jgi:hypothetical protein
MFSIAKGSYIKHSMVSATLTRSNSGQTQYTVQRYKTGNDEVFLVPKNHKIKVHRMQAHNLSQILDLGTDGSEWSPSCFSCFIPKEKSSDIHCIKGWVGHTAVQIWQQREKSCLL